MVALTIVTLALVAAFFAALRRLRRCGWRREALMVECQILGPHRCHLFETDEWRYARERWLASQSVVLAARRW